MCICIGKRKISSNACGMVESPTDDSPTGTTAAGIDLRLISSFELYNTTVNSVGYEGRTLGGGGGGVESPRRGRKESAQFQPRSCLFNEKERRKIKGHFNPATIDDTNAFEKMRTAFFGRCSLVIFSV